MRESTGLLHASRRFVFSGPSSSKGNRRVPTDTHPFFLACVSTLPPSPKFCLTCPAPLLPFLLFAAPTRSRQSRPSLLCTVRRAMPTAAWCRPRRSRVAASRSGRPISALTSPLSSSCACEPPTTAPTTSKACSPSDQVRKPEEENKKRRKRSWGFIIVWSLFCLLFVC